MFWDSHEKLTQWLEVDVLILEYKGELNYVPPCLATFWS